MSYAWFLHTGEVVSGPFTTTEVNNLVTAGRIPPSSTIWWKGQREWLPLSFWQDNVSQIIESVESQIKNAIWFFEVDRKEQGPYTQLELVNQLKSRTDLEVVRVWTHGSEKRMNPFEMHDLMELIGKNRREYERTPITGSVKITSTRNHLMEYRVKAFSISVGGLGVVGKHDLRRGDPISIMLDSTELGGSFSAQAEIAYVTEQGYTGIRFTRASEETMAKIHAYVTKFAPKARKAA